MRSASESSSCAAVEALFGDANGAALEGWAPDGIWDLPHPAGGRVVLASPDERRRALGELRSLLAASRARELRCGVSADDGACMAEWTLHFDRDRLPVSGALIARAAEGKLTLLREHYDPMLLPERAEGWRFHRARKPLSEQLRIIRERGEASMSEADREVLARHVMALRARKAQVPKAGDIAPSFVLDAHDGTSFVSIGCQPLVVAFFRGVWCPSCRAELEALQELAPRFVAQGAKLVAISPQKAEWAQATVARLGLTFPVLVDPGCRTAEKFGLAYDVEGDLRDWFLRQGVDLEAYNGDELPWRLPMPSRFVVLVGGRLLQAEAFEDYRERADVGETLMKLIALNDPTVLCS